MQITHCKPSKRGKVKQTLRCKPTHINGKLLSDKITQKLCNLIDINNRKGEL